MAAGDHNSTYSDRSMEMINAIKEGMWMIAVCFVCLISGVGIGAYIATEIIEWKPRQEGDKDVEKMDHRG